MKRIMAVIAAPVLLAGLLLAGSSGFGGTSKSTSTLNTLSDTIHFGGTAIVGRSSFTFHSTWCNLTDALASAQGVNMACAVTASGTVNPTTSASSGPVAVTGPDGAITFKQTSFRGCAVGTGYEVDPGPALVPIRVEASSSWWPTSADTFAVTGTIQVYEAGGITAGISCD